MTTHSHDATAIDRYPEIRKVTLVGSAVDMLLTILKVAVGISANSQALIADGVHSLSDVATDVMVIMAAKHGSRDADETHPYGHGRIETLATVALGIALVAVALGLGWDAASRLFHPAELLQPGVWALIIAALSVVAKEWTFQYTMRLARKLNSKMLRANAWHSRSDAISSIVVVVGVAGTMAGLPYLDAIAAVGVALMIAKIGFDLAWESVHELIDTALEAERVDAIRKIILSVDGVVALHMLRTRLMGGDALVDVHILVDPRVSVSEGHHISETVRTRLCREVDEVQDVLVHIDPEDDSKVPRSLGLPSRKILLEKLRPRWEGVVSTDRIERVQLHYLDGKVGVELYLPLDLAADAQQAAELARSLSEAGCGLDEVASVRVFFA